MQFPTQCLYWLNCLYFVLSPAAVALLHPACTLPIGLYSTTVVESSLRFSREDAHQSLTLCVTGLRAMLKDLLLTLMEYNTRSMTYLFSASTLYRPIPRQRIDRNRSTVMRHGGPSEARWYWYVMSMLGLLILYCIVKL